MENELEREFEKQGGIAKAKVGLVVCVVLIAILAISNIWFFLMVYPLETDKNNLQRQVSGLQTDIAVLQAQYESLQTNYTSAITEKEDLEALYDSLFVLFEDLMANCTSFEAEYELLKSNYTTLQTDFETLQIQYDSLQLLHDDLQAEYNSYLTEYQRLRDTINHRWGLEDLENFITPSDSTVETFVLNITGGWSNTSDWDECWYDLQEMYYWVVNNIEYDYDGLYPNLPYDPTGGIDHWDEMWQFPNETLDLGHGDCEDMAILLCSMIRCYNNMDLWTECISIANSFGHVAVQCPIEGDKLVIFDPAGQYYSCDLWGNIIFNDISTEIDNWLSYWEPEMGIDVYVDFVFSDYIHETFVSTDDYIAWMYSR